jgi:hypothetical protein
MRFKEQSPEKKKITTTLRPYANKWDITQNLTNTIPLRTACAPTGNSAFASTKGCDAQVKKR